MSSDQSLERVTRNTFPEVFLADKCLAFMLCQKMVCFSLTFLEYFADMALQCHSAPVHYPQVLFSRKTSGHFFLAFICMLELSANYLYTSQLLILSHIFFLKSWCKIFQCFPTLIVTSKEPQF